MKHLFFCLLCLLASTTIIAQTADEIIAKHLAAKGGAALDSVKTAEMDMVFFSQKAPLLKATMTNRIVNMQAHRSDMSIPQFYDGVVCFDGNSGWSTLKMGGETKVEIIDSLGVKDLKFQTEIMGPLHRYQEKGYTATYLGLDSVGGSVVHKIKIDATNQMTYFSFIETTSFTELKRSATAPSSGAMITVDLYFSEIKPVEGILMPHKTEMHNRKGVSFFEYTRIALNPDLDPGLFKKPDVGQK